HAALYAERALGRGTELEAYRTLLDGSTHVARGVRSQLGEYARRAGISTQLVPAVRMITWALHAVPEQERLRADVAETDAALGASTFLGFWREEVARSVR